MYICVCKVLDEIELLCCSSNFVFSSYFYEENWRKDMTVKKKIYMKMGRKNKRNTLEEKMYV